MSDFLNGYSIQRWLESCPQGYLDGTEYGHEPGQKEPDTIVEQEFLRDRAIQTTVQLVAGERCALAASSGLIGCAPDDASKIFLATQTLDEARHVEIFTQRLIDLGVKKADLDSVVADLADPNLIKFAEALLEKVDKKDFVAGVVGQNLILEGMAFSVFEMLQAMNAKWNPKFARTLSGTIADERRHVGFGENRIGSLIRQYPEKKAEVERMQKEMSFHMLATFANQLRDPSASRELEWVSGNAPEPAADEEPATWQGAALGELKLDEIENLLSSTVLREFKTRLGRVGVDYQTPALP